MSTLSRMKNCGWPQPLWLALRLETSAGSSYTLVPNSCSGSASRRGAGIMENEEEKGLPIWASQDQKGSLLFHVSFPGTCQ
eukprot:9197587-Pyramimonas_sp.AAC.1